MSYKLESRCPYQAACTQYTIYPDKPVDLTLSGPRSYCYLKGISNEKLKEALCKVGVTYEKTKYNTFFNFSHVFTPTEANEEYKENDDLVKDIFGFVNEAINDQTKSQLNLEFADMTRLNVEKGEDRSFLQPSRAFRLSVSLTESAVEKAQKAGLVFREYGTSSSSNQVVARIVHVGEYF